jgi:predicted amidohydrolase
MSARIGIAGLQLELGAHTNNLPKIRSRIDQLMETFPWVEMVICSELAVFGASTSHAAPLPSPAEEELAALAKRHAIWLIPGTMFEDRGDGTFNTLSVIDPRGEVIARYRKLFPFRPYELGVEAGDELVVFDVPEVGRFGVSICYDIWFPETTRSLAAMGAEVILHPAMTTTIDRDVELAITRASAATNQCFVFDINGAGEVGNGRSIIAGPAGEVRHQAGTSEEIIPLEIDLDEVRRSRENGSFNLGQPLKSFRDRRVKLAVYEGPSEYLNRLGPLAKARREPRTKA